MAPQPDRGDVAKTIGGNPRIFMLGKLLSFAQDLRNTACRYVLFCHDQVHGSHTSFFSSSVSSLFNSPGSAHPRVFFMSWPMRKLNAPFFPFRKSSTAAGCSERTSVMDVRSEPIIGSHASPDFASAVTVTGTFFRSSRLTIAEGVSQDWLLRRTSSMTRNTSIPLLSVMMPCFRRVKSYTHL